MEIRKPNLSSAAVILKQRMAAKGIKVTHAEALEHAAAMEGFQSYQAYQSHQKEIAAYDKPLLIQEGPSESGRDYRFVGKKGEGVWIRMRNISVYLKADDEGVVADLFNSGMEGEGSEATTYHMYQDASSAQLEYGDEIVDMRDHIKSLLASEGVTILAPTTDELEWSWSLKGKTHSPFISEWSALQHAFETLF